MQLVVGVDLSTRSCGLAVVGLGPDGNVWYWKSWQIQSPLKCDQWGRLYYVTEAIANHLSDMHVAAVVFERVRLFHRGKVSLAAIRDLARLQGAIGLIARDKLDGAQVVEVDVRQWRRAVLGDGNAGKSEVVKWASSFSDKESLGVDEAEAIALAYYGTLAYKAAEAGRRLRRSSTGSDGAFGDRNREAPLFGAGGASQKTKQTQQSTQRKRSKRGGATNGGRSRTRRPVDSRSSKRQK